MKIYTYFAILFVLLLITAGCSGAAMEKAAAPDMQSAADMPGEPYYEYEDAAEEGAATSARYDDGESVPLEDYLASAVKAQEMRVIIYTGNISLVVKDTEESVKDITALADAEGGYVADANVYQSGEVLRGNISIRVPAERYQDVMAQLRGLALRVERESSSSQDVTEEFTDLQARKTNLEHTEAALQQLLDERQRVGSTSDILEVHRELTNIRGQIEQIEGRLRYLSNQAALSTISIELIPDVLYQPISVAGWEPQGVAKEALQTLIVALQGLVNLLIWGVIFILPLLIIMLIPLVILILVIRWWWTRRSRKKDDKKQKDTEQKVEEKEKA